MESNLCILRAFGGFIVPGEHENKSVENHRWHFHQGANVAKGP
jgi:hypothetical protein